MFYATEILISCEFRLKLDSLKYRICNYALDTDFLLIKTTSSIYRSNAKNFR